MHALRLRTRRPLCFRVSADTFVDHFGKRQQLRGGRVAFNAYRGRRIVGSLCYLPGEEYAPVAQIETLWVRPDERGGTIMLSLCRHALALGAFPMKSHIDDPRLAALYRRARERSGCDA